VRKYWYFFKSHLSTRFEYRAEGFLWALIELVMLSFAIFVWTAIYRDNQMVGSYTLAQMVLYYALIPIVGNLVYVHGLTTHLAKNIKDGQIAMEIIKPYNVSFNHFLGSTSVKVFQMLVKMPIFYRQLFLFHSSLRFNSH
jgi:ABC-2 type transport system permease protein